MKTKIQFVLKITGVLFLLLLISGFFSYRYFNETFLGFEDHLVQPSHISELRIDGYTFLDRNGNGALDIYEDERQPLNIRVEDVLSQMTLEEKIHLLKGSGVASAMGNVKPGGIPGAVGTIVPTPRWVFRPYICLMVLRDCEFSLLEQERIERFIVLLFQLLPFLLPHGTKISYMKLGMQWVRRQRPMVSM